MADESARLIRLEQSLTALWERVEAGEQRAEQRHGEVLQLYTDLQEQLVTAQSSGYESWLEEQFRTRLDEERRQREQVRSWTHHPWTGVQVVVWGLCYM